MTAQIKNVAMNRTAVCALFVFLFLVGLGVPGVQAQQPAVAEPQAPNSTLQTPREAVPTLPVPRLVKFAGALNDEQGKPRTGVVGVSFAVYKEQEGGAALWLETQNVQLDEQGHYTVLLGATKSEGLPLELFSAGEPRWLGVQVNLPHEAEQPRVLLVSVPYALKAADADTLGGKPVSSFVLTEGAGGSGGGSRGAIVPQAIGGSGAQNVVAKFDATGTNVTNSSISDDGSRVTVGEGINFGSDFSFVGNAEPAKTGRVQLFDRANVGFVLRGLNLLVETLQGNAFTPTEVMRWTQAGNVGIGTASPRSKVDIAGGIDLPFAFSVLNSNAAGIRWQSGADANSAFGFEISGGLWFQGSFGTGNQDFGVRLPTSGASSLGPVAFVVKGASGNVGIGTATPGVKLDVAGDIRTTSCFEVMSTVVSGTCLSDLRLKTNIQPFSPVLAKLARLRPVHFDWRTADYPERHFDSSRSSGLIAQEVERVLPELVSVDAEGFKRVNYTELPYLMLEAIRELKAQNDRLQSQVKELRAVVVRIADQQAVERAAADHPRPIERQ